MGGTVDIHRRPTMRSFTNVRAEDPSLASRSCSGMATLISAQPLVGQRLGPEREPDGPVALALGIEQQVMVEQVMVEHRLGAGAGPVSSSGVRRMQEVGHVGEVVRDHRC